MAISMEWSISPSRLLDPKPVAIAQVSLLRIQTAKLNPACRVSRDTSRLFIARDSG